jgi:VanZ family protein
MLFGLLLVPVIDEFIQLFSAGRAGMVQDILLDFSGAVTGLVVVKILHKYVRE